MSLMEINFLINWMFLGVVICFLIKKGEEKINKKDEDKS